MELSISVRNIRRIQEMPYVALKPITILLGRNSAGKSTLLRSLPLLRQSLETSSSAPVLWYGKYVDFGDFKTAVEGGAGREDCSFKFKVEKLSNRYRWGGARKRYMSPTRVDVESLEIEYVLAAYQDNTHLKEIKLLVPEEGIDLRLSLRKSGAPRAIFNEEDISHLCQGTELYTAPGSLFAAPLFLLRSKDRRAVLNTFELSNQNLITFLKDNTDKRLSQATIYNEARRIWDNLPFSHERLMHLSEGSSTNVMTEFYREAASDQVEKKYIEFKKVIGFGRALQILDVLEKVLPKYFSGVSYMGPARAAGERYYRRQELEVAEIAPTGENFPMYLRSLSRTAQESFSSFVSEIFGFGVDITTNGGHISINIVTPSGRVNITDTGYGVSQLLPVLGALWSATRRAMGRSPIFEPEEITHRVIAIEQPELHLHPAHQARLADVFAAVVRGGDNSKTEKEVRIIVETHSEALIQRIGELIDAKTIDHEDVEIAIFSAEDDLNSPPVISRANYDSRGVMKSWPHGFFNYSDDLLV